MKPSSNFSFKITKPENDIQEDERVTSYSKKLDGEKVLTENQRLLMISLQFENFLDYERNRQLVLDGLNFE